MKTIEESSSFETLVSEQVNRTLRKGSIVTSLLGFGSGALLFLATQMGIVKDIEVPILWTVIGGTYALFIYFLARKKKVEKKVSYLVMFGLVSMPTVIYVFAFFLLEAGTATYVNGPPSYLYFFLIVVTGFSFNYRLSFYSGLFAAAQYLLVIISSADQIRYMQHPNVLMQQDNTEIMFYLFRPIMMAVTGLVTGVIGRHVRDLITESIIKEKEKAHINRLFGLYVSPEIREKVTTSRAETAGEKKMLAILFCDIRNFTSLSERKPPEELVAELNEYFTAMAEAIAFESGTIDKFIGDAVMAVFGGAIELENPSQSALDAALHMRRNLVRLNELRKSVGKPPLENGIGLHFGEVFIGSIGSTERKDYTIIGDAVNTASRIEALCKEYNNSLLFSEDFYRQLPSDIASRCSFLNETAVKGRAEKIRIYTLN